MDRYSDVVQNENGRAVPGASILIVGADGQPATIYSDRQGAPLANPLVTDSLGRWSFCAADGVYTARVSLNGTIRATLQDIRLEDPDDGFASLARTTGAGLICMTDGRTVQTAFSALSDTVAGITNYSLPTASNTILGGVKVGTGLAIDGNGLLSATGVTQGSVSSVNGVNPNSSGAVNLSTDDLAEDSSPSNLWFTPQRVRDTALTGLSLSTGSAITATDTVLTAPGKLQAQVTANATALAAKQDASGKGTANGYAALGASRELLLPNAAGTFTSTLSNVNTAARALVLPDKAGTLATLDDISTGAITKLLSVDIAGSPAIAVNFTGSILSNPQCSKFIVEISGLKMSNFAETLFCFTRTVSGSLALLNTQVYRYIYFTPGSTSTSAPNTFSSTSLSLNTSQKDGVTITLSLTRTTPAGAGFTFRAESDAAPGSGNTSQMQYTRGDYYGTDIPEGFRIFPGGTSNTITQGIITLYGLTR